MLGLYYLLQENFILSSFNNSFFSLFFTLIGEFVSLTIDEKFSYPFHFCNLLSTGSYFILDLEINRRRNWYDEKKYDSLFVYHHWFSLYSFFVTLLFFPFEKKILILGSRIVALTEISGFFWSFLQQRMSEKQFLPLPIWYNKIFAGITFFIVFFIFRFLLLPIYLLSLSFSPLLPFYFLSNLPSIIGLYTICTIWLIQILQAGKNEIFLN